MVLRVPIGGYVSGGAIWHSQSGESIFTHIPGLTVVMPSRAADAVGPAATAFQAEDPVLFLEHKHLLRQPYTRDPFPSRDFQIPFGRGRVVAGRRRAHHRDVGRPGRKVPAGGRRVWPRRTAAPSRSSTCDPLLPWDRDLVATEVARTGRLLVAHEDVLTGGFGAEVAPGSASTASRTWTLRCGGSAQPTLTSPTSRPWRPPSSPGRGHHRRGPGAARLLASGAWLTRCAASSPPKKGRRFGVETVLVPDPGPGEAVVAVRACGVCHTDLHYREGAINDDFPFLLGHEAAGTSRRSAPG